MVEIGSKPGPPRTHQGLAVRRTVATCSVASRGQQAISLLRDPGQNNSADKQNGGVS